MFFLNDTNRDPGFYFKSPVQLDPKYLINYRDYPIKPQATGILIYPAWLDYFYRINTPYKSETPLMTINFNIGI